MNFTSTNQSQPFTISEILKVPGLDVYEQMVCFVLNNLINDGNSLPTVAEVASKGRMSSKEATQAMQNLVEKKIIPLRVFREMVGNYGDSRLSWAAKGLLLYLKQHEGNTLSDLLEVSKDDTDNILIELKELHRLGYLEDHSIIDELG
ncbi:hypothetical protein GC093_04990 [Paenibacillus sp. LMG 31456]|uniref:Uncharacterized protein n=1 Tax=Paenibacillus foliorum TaxID=2654974 RepID=A0A972GM81_9BACL|nr:hypothetical protein [Paenibacillus foliorum]NOU92585.1 hypothetical protein [Paenibacillus foliorum]